MNAFLVNQALVQVVRQCCPAELLRKLQAQAEQITLMLAAIDQLEENREREDGSRWASCCRVCFQVRLAVCCTECRRRVCGACITNCDQCGSYWCPACQPVAPCGTCGRALLCCPVCAAPPDCRKQNRICTKQTP